MVVVGYLFLILLGISSPAHAFLDLVPSFLPSDTDAPAVLVLKTKEKLPLEKALQSFLYSRRMSHSFDDLIPAFERSSELHFPYDQYFLVIVSRQREVPSALSSLKSFSFVEDVSP